MITYDGLKKRKCSIADGKIVIETGQFQVESIKEVEEFKGKQARVLM